MLLFCVSLRKEGEDIENNLEWILILVDKNRVR